MPSKRCGLSCCSTLYTAEVYCLQVSDCPPVRLGVGILSLTVTPWFIRQSQECLFCGATVIHQECSEASRQLLEPLCSPGTWIWLPQYALTLTFPPLGLAAELSAWGCPFLGRQRLHRANHLVKAAAAACVLCGLVTAMPRALTQIIAHN